MAREPSRELGVDVYRGACVVAMFAVHTARLQTRRTNHGLAEQLAQTSLDVLARLEPFVSASFVFIAGASAVLAARHDQRAERVLRRSVLLWSLSVGLFVAHYGFVLPDVLVSPGILSPIAAGSLLASLALRSSRPALALASVALPLLLAQLGLELLGARVIGVNAGDGALLPDLLFALAGAALALLWQSQDRRALPSALSSLAACSSAALLAGPWTSEHLRFYPRYGGETLLAALGQGTLPRALGWEPITFWAHTTAGFIGWLLPLVATATALKLGLRRARRALAAAAYLGRYALFAYLGHLAVLAAVDAASLAPASALQTWLVVALLVGACVAPAALARRRIDAYSTAKPGA